MDLETKSELNNSKKTQESKDISSNFPKNEEKTKQNNKINSSLLLNG